MRTRDRILLLIAALAPLSLQPLAQAQTPGIPPSGGTPIVISGRIVTEEGVPLPGVNFMSAPTSSGFMGLPQMTLFHGVPPACVTIDSGASSVATDAQGRYRLTARFHPEVQAGSRACSEFAGRLRREYLNFSPLPPAGYQLRVATGPLPGPRANLPAGALKPKKSPLPGASIDPSAIRR